MPRYAELQVTTNFSFLRGGSHGEELVEQAAALGLAAVAVTDRNTLAGVVRAHVAAKEVGLPLLVGARLDLMDAPDRLVFPVDRAAYGRLSRLISRWISCGIRLIGDRRARARHSEHSHDEEREGTTRCSATNERVDVKHACDLPIRRPSVLVRQEVITAGLRIRCECSPQHFEWAQRDSNPRHLPCKGSALAN